MIGLASKITNKALRTMPYKYNKVTRFDSYETKPDPHLYSYHDKSGEWIRNTKASLHIHIVVGTVCQFSRGTEESFFTRVSRHMACLTLIISISKANKIHSKGGANSKHLPTLLTPLTNMESSPLLLASLTKPNAPRPIEPSVS